MVIGYPCYRLVDEKITPEALYMMKDIQITQLSQSALNTTSYQIEAFIEVMKELAHSPSIRIDPDTQNKIETICL